MARIVHITTVHPALDIRIFQKQCRTLARAGYDVTLIAPRDHDAPRIERIDDIAIRALPKPLSRRERMFGTVRLALRMALELDADLYHLHDPELLTIAGRLRLRGRRQHRVAPVLEPVPRSGRRSYPTLPDKGLLRPSDAPVREPGPPISKHVLKQGSQQRGQEHCPVVFDMHENLPKDLLTKPWLPALLRRPASRAAGLAQRVLLRGVSVVMAEDSYATDYPWLPDVTVLRNMPLVDELLAIRPPHPELSVPTLGYMGSISPARGSTTTLEALGMLREQGIRCGLELIGPMSNQSHAAELHAQVRRLDLELVNTTGWLPGPEAWRRMSLCQVGLALLQNHPNFVHSYPTKMFEYMALGLPVVVSDFPLYRQVVDSTGCGLCVNPNDPKAISAALARLIKNPKEAQVMGHRGRRAVVERYRWSEEAKKLLFLYDRILENSDRSFAPKSDAA